MELFVDSNRGIYAWREAYKSLKLSIKRQLKLSKQDRYALTKGSVNSENYYFAIEQLENKDFKHAGKVYSLQQSEHGDIWLLENGENFKDEN